MDIHKHVILPSHLHKRNQRHLLIIQHIILQQIEQHNHQIRILEKQFILQKTGSKYHRAGCRYLRKSQIAISLSEAKNEGYTACSVCF